MRCVLGTSHPRFLIRRFTLKMARLRPWAFLVLALAALGARGHATAKSIPEECGAPGPEIDAASDVHAFEEYQNAINQLLQQGKFKQLDCLADAARSQKARLPGGNWKLRLVYGGVSDQETHATEIDWKDRLKRLQHWVDERPNSTTARIALAEAYTHYAWFARGHGTADDVSDSGWKLFSGRMKKAREILEQNLLLKEECPEWYAVMLDVAQGEGWDRERADALVQQATAFEPTYDAYYRTYALFLLPKWYGKDGDTERFAQESADRVRGEDGDILYFQIAKELVCTCESPQFSHMSWPRIQKGFDVLGKKYGQSLVSINSYALMAVNQDDSVLADTLFKRIGDKWDKETWRTEDYFEQMRTSSAEWAPLQAHGRAIKQEAETNMQSTEGAAYLKRFQPKFAVFLQKCREAGANDPTGFELAVQIAKDGGVQDASANTPTNAANCLFVELRRSHEHNETPFPPPPAAAYWLQFNIDPAMFKRTAN
jgi:Domain of unknown function (DUF4034)